MKTSTRNILFALCILVVIVVMAGPLWSLMDYALDRENTHASQIVLIPFISVALIYMNRENIFRETHLSVLSALPLLVLGVGLVVAGRTWGAGLEEGNRLSLMASSAVILWLGCFLLFFGTTAFRAAKFPLLFMVFFIPIPTAFLNVIVAILQRGSSEIAFVILK